MPPAQRVARATLELCCQSAEEAPPLTEQLGGIDYPIIVRPIDSHAGNGLSKIESLSDLTGYLVQATQEHFFVSPFIDYRNADGLFRKYRIILIGGVPYVCHMAISTRWMVHYLNADMLTNAGHRAEEAQFMAHFDRDFAVHHAAAFKAIYSQLGLDYVGIDCAQTPDGQLLVFEVDSNMVVHNMDSAEIFPYKKIQMPKLFNAFGQLLAQRCGLPL
jgi:glutathione synthase/RimK-type ligase-like ATP-grasp enzyme